MNAHVNIDGQSHMNTPLYLPDWQIRSLGGPIDPFVPDDWNKVVVVGKAPGAVERLENKPFAGKSGVLLNRLMRIAGFDPDRTMLTNAFMMQPSWTLNAEGRRTQNDISLFFTDEAKYGNQRLPPYHGKWVMTGYDAEIRKLWAFLQKHKPDLIIAVGDIALWSLTGKDTISENIGQFHETRCVPTPVFATYHPAYALHKESEEIANQIAGHLKHAAGWLEDLHKPKTVAIGDEPPF